jgi:hypothetical protein
MMKEYKKLLASFVEVVTFLFASFGGFLKNIAPPDQVGASYPVGIMAFLMLVILLAISAIGRNAPTQTGRKKWITAGIMLFFLALPASFLYPYLLSHHTYPHQLELSKRQISASDEYLTPDARQYKAANPEATAEDLSQNLPDGDVWTRHGVERTEIQLLAAYACLVLTLSGAIFCLLEANIRAESEASSLTATASSVK